MKVNFYNPINFTATKYAEIPKVMKFNPQTKSYEDEEISLVEIDIHNKKDFTSMLNAVKDWDNNEFATDIILDAFALRHVPDKGETKFLALTSQKNNFDYLDFKKIQVLCELKEDESGEHASIEYLQAKPLSYYDNSYKKKGTGLINVLKEIYKKISLVSSDKTETMEFYERNGFRPNRMRERGYTWEKEI